MLKKIKDIDINYIDYGEGKDTVVLLHGWGQNIEMMKPIGKKIIREEVCFIPAKLYKKCTIHTLISVIVMMTPMNHSRFNVLKSLKDPFKGA